MPYQIGQRMRFWLLNILFFLSTIAYSQSNFEFKGQLSAIGNYSPQNTMSLLLGTRYIPQINYKISLDSVRKIDFEASAFLSGSTFSHPFDSTHFASSVQPYRLWARYSSKQFELRIGLQKIDFGSATLLRPIQWFNQIDPRDPLKLTNGVYGVLGRYYFINNANAWLWVLYGNQKARGFDVVETNKHTPEIGGRLQYPTPKGEIALSFHHRTANSENLSYLPSFNKIPENRIGLDAKWNLKIGLWFEAVYVHKSKNIDLMTNQTLLNMGADYTFGVGNGINIMAEHLLASFDKKPFAFGKTINVSAITLSYPLGIFDRLSTIFYYTWATSDLTLFLNYEHQFKNFSTYFMPYYNPPSQLGILQNNLINQFSGYGIRCMLVYNH